MQSWSLLEPEMDPALKSEYQEMEDIEESPTLKSEYDRAEEFEKDVTDLIMGLSKSGGKATPMKASVDKIAKIIKNDMMVKVKPAHAADQKELNTLAAAVLMCRTDRYAQLNISHKTRLTYKVESKLHKPCRTVEDGLYNQNVACKTERHSLKEIKELKCKQYSEVAKKLSDQAANNAIVKKGQSESVEAYIKRMTDTFCGAKGGKGNGGAGVGGFLDQLLNAKQACEKATKKYND
jgi:hypothetical protein